MGAGTAADVVAGLYIAGVCVVGGLALVGWLSRQARPSGRRGLGGTEQCGRRPGQPLLPPRDPRRGGGASGRAPEDETLH